MRLQKKNLLLFGLCLCSTVSLTGCSQVYDSLPEPLRDAAVSIIINAVNSDKDELKADVDLYRPAFWDFDRLNKKVLANPNNAFIHRNRGRALYWSDLPDHYKSALKDYDKAISLDGSHANWYDERASALSFEDRKAEALKDCDTAIRLDSTKATFYGSRASIYSELGKNEEARKDYAKATSLEPGSYAADYADTLVKCGKDKEALAVYHQVMSDKENYDSSVAYEPVIAIYMRQGKFDLARKTVNAWKTAEPETSSAFECSAKMFELFGEHAEAQADYRQLVKLFKEQDAEDYQWVEQANYFDKLNQTDKAHEARRKALALYEKDDDDNLDTRADLYEKLGQVDKARELRERSLRENRELIATTPDDADAYHYRAQAFEELKRDEDALKDYERAMELTPNNNHYIGHHADLLNSLKRYSETVKECKAALKKNSHDANTVIRAIAEASERLGNHEDAIAYATTLIDLDATDGDAYYWRAQAYRKVGKKDLADRDQILWKWFKADCEEDEPS